MNLLLDAWIPVQRKSGKQALIAPWQLTETIDPIVQLNAPRSDFNGALLQFLIGVFQTAHMPKDEQLWLDALYEPPSSSTLKQAFESYADAFALQSVKGSFMQDFEVLDTEPNGISDLLIDAPGGNTIKENKDFFVKRGRVEQLCPCCATTALFTLQTNAPSGGAGHRTSIRGGGPLTTLIMVDDKQTVGSQDQDALPNDLWRNVWLNVLDQVTFKHLTGDHKQTARGALFPWMAATRTSEKGGKDTTSLDAHPLQMYWGMPRRIRVDWDSSLEGTCDLCNTHSQQLVTQYRTKNYGVNYTGAWKHPLSPYSINSKTGEALPQHAQPNGMTYQHWLGFIESTNQQHSALVIERYLNVSANWNDATRLYVFGYDMDNMKARCWYEAVFPLYFVADDLRVAFSKNIQLLTTTATDVAVFVRTCVKEGWCSRPSVVKGDASFITKSFYQRTEASFFQLAQALPNHIQTQSEKELLNAWHKILMKTAFDLFDYWAAGGDIAQGNPRIVADARAKLRNLLFGKSIKEALMLPQKSKTKEAA
ncbi:MAG: type I-E CRISPR-associated protein Cse1/CasA [Thiothrix sp.]|nr:MAG: type I-E CRISPR-associated protein Cse1/CasA [Thiothrix sp.]